MTITDDSSVLVVKVGGTEGVDFGAVCSDVQKLKSEGRFARIVLVHGGSSEANILGNGLGHPPVFVTSPSGFTSRYTDRRTLEIFCMAVNGKINTLFVEQLQRMGVNGLGLSGVDGRLLQATRKDSIRVIENGKQKILRDDFTGKIEQVNSKLLFDLLSLGYTPVVAPLAISPSGEALNVDADRAAAMIAAALNAKTLILLTGVKGLMREFPNEATLIKTIARNRLDDALNYAQGRMKKKVLGAQEALDGGVRQVIFADGRIQEPIYNALAGEGTTIE